MRLQTKIFKLVCLDVLKFLEQHNSQYLVLGNASLYWDVDEPATVSNPEVGLMDLSFIWDDLTNMLKEGVFFEHSYIWVADILEVVGDVLSNPNLDLKFVDKKIDYAFAIELKPLIHVVKMILAEMESIDTVEFEIDAEMTRYWYIPRDVAYIIKKGFKPNPIIRTVEEDWSQLKEVFDEKRSPEPCDLGAMGHIFKAYML